MKVAVATQDGKTVAQHFGGAPLYAVFSIESGEVISREVRPKAAHQHHTGHSQHEAHFGEEHTLASAEHVTHATMVQNIADCDVVLAGSMGRGAYEALKDYDVEPILTDITSIEEAVAAYIAGKLENLSERVH